MPFPRHAHLDPLAMGLMVVLCFGWGFQQVAIKVVLSDMSPILMAGLRSAVAALLLWAWSAHRKIPLFESDGSLKPGMIAGVMFAGEFLLIYLGLTYTTASRNVLFLYTTPFVVAIGAHIFLPAERLRPVHVVGLLCAFAGILTAFSDGLSLPNPRALIGDAMALAAALCWGATTLVVKASRLATVSPNKTLFYQLAVSGVVLPPCALLLGEPGIIALTPTLIGSFVYQAVVVAFVSYLAWFWLVAHYPAGRLSAFAFLTPLFGMILGGWLLGEPISPLLILAMALVGTGIYLVNKR